MQSRWQFPKAQKELFLIIIISIHCCSSCPSQCNKARKINKKYKDKNGKNKLTLFPDHNDFEVENIEKLTNKLL